jgi:enamine deaminase RidA (YjgF/YER057c/UK114 family)
MPHKKEKVHTTDAPAPPSFLSQGVVVGDMVYVSGAIGVDPKTNQLVEGTIQDRTVGILTAIHNIMILIRSLSDPVPKEHLQHIRCCRYFHRKRRKKTRFFFS